MPDWTGDPGQWRDAPAPRTATTPLPEAEFAGSHRASPLGRRQAFWPGWPGPLAERRWLVATGAGVAALVIIGGMILFLSRPPSKVLANAPASARKAIPVAHPRATSHPGATHPTARHSPARARTHPTPSATRSSSASPSPKPTATPTASPAQPMVKVSYAVVRQHPNNFQGQFTIVNEGSAMINGWELVVVLPGDDIRSVSDASFRTSGATLYIEPFPSQRSIPPGAKVTERFSAHGSTTAPTSCTFNGSPC